MGGWGSGARWSRKSTNADYLRLDIRRLHREQMLEPGLSYSWQWTCNDEPYANINIQTRLDHIILSYRHRQRGEEWQSKEYPVYLTETRYNYGGVRKWFLCPVLRCGRRVAVLYGAGLFACRQCHQMAYETQRQSVSDRADSRAWKIRKRCVERGKEDWGGLLDPVFKPKGMHQRTFDRLERQYAFYSRTSIESFAAKMKVSAEELLGGW